jgi:hypothetical protein
VIATEAIEALLLIFGTHLSVFNSRRKEFCFLPSGQIQKVEGFTDW